MQPHDLLKFGIIPELVGRLPVITALQGLTREDLVRILTEPKNALVKQYQKLLSYDGVELAFRAGCAGGGGRQGASARNIGARGLRAVMEGTADQGHVRCALRPHHHRCDHHDGRAWTARPSRRCMRDPEKVAQQRQIQDRHSGQARCPGVLTRLKTQERRGAASPSFPMSAQVRREKGDIYGNDHP